MTNYKVIIEPVAANDLAGSVDYISKVLLEPTIAAKLYRNIKDQISSLSNMPKRNHIVSDDRYASVGLRTHMMKNYIAYYTVDDQDNTVHILRILYNRREWQDTL